MEMKYLKKNALIDSECILFFKMAFSNISAHSLVYLYDCATSSRGGGGGIGEQSKQFVMEQRV